MTDPKPPLLPPTPPPTSRAASRAVLVTAVLALIGLSVAAWVLASTTDTDTDGEVGDVATDTAEPTETGTPTEPTGIDRYVALGDSMTSAPFLPTVDDSSPCMRSSQNYPSRIARELEIRHFVDVSCGGATTDDVHESQHPGVPPQLDAVTPETDLVTLTLGANDFDTYSIAIPGCAKIAARSPEGAPCRAFATADGGDSMVERIDEIGPRLESVLGDIHQRAPEARVILVGYPRFLPESGTCPATLPFATGDYPYLASLMRRLNDTQRAAAEATDSEFVDMYAASAGHDPCSSDPWMNGANAVPGGAAAFHAFPKGQAAMAREILELLD